MAIRTPTRYSSSEQESPVEGLKVVDQVRERLNARVRARPLPGTTAAPRGEFRTPITSIPAAWAERMPGIESSNAMQRSDKPSRVARK